VFVVFVGNLSFETTEAEIREHFNSVGGTITSVRLLTKKGTNGSKGCGFIQFDTAVALQAALQLHHTQLGNRQINVEITAGGGGTGANRKQKLLSKNSKLTAERQRRKQAIAEGYDDSYASYA